MRTAPDVSLPAQQVFKLIEHELQHVEDRLKSEATSHLGLITRMNEYLHDSGGKRLRPSLLLLLSKLCRLEGDVSIQLGVVVELIHVATLVHDDIIDHSTVRRGRASLNAKWGDEKTVLFGDWLYMTAFWLALQERNFRILDVLIDITRTMVEGELLQLEYNNRLDISSEDHLSICWRKTAHLFSGCGRLPAILAKVDADTEERLASYGRSVGMAFQLVDDLLDYTADEQVLGKPVLKDLEEGKVTLPIIYLMERAGSAEKDMVRRIVESREFTDENKHQIIELVNKYGTLQDLQSLADKYAEQAQEMLADFPDSIYRDALLEIPKIVVRRQK
ncbi:MAG TPA: polyprenyl synthetase family protein [Acidobacteriota bacterium]|nr:polyprenyl synthetase family protein [Acidobacteriota bacterium]